MSPKPHRVTCVLWVASSCHLPWDAVWRPGSLEGHSLSPTDVKEQASPRPLLALRPALSFGAHRNIFCDRKAAPTTVFL